MKRFMLFVGLTIASLNTLAQSAGTFGIKGGVNFAQLHSSFSNSGGSSSSGYLPTFSGGIFVDYEFSAVSIQPGINFTGRGADENQGDTHLKVRLYYLQVPVNVVYHFDIDPGIIYIGAGPYVAYGVSGHIKGTLDGNPIDVNANFGTGTNNYKPLDVGAGAIAGIKFDTGLMINLSYDFGLINISNIAGTNTTNRVFGLSVGYALK